jgi:hypothetical protein
MYNVEIHTSTSNKNSFLLESTPSMQTTRTHIYKHTTVLFHISILSQITRRSEGNYSVPDPVYHSCQRPLPPTNRRLDASTLRGYLLSQSSAPQGSQPDICKVHELEKFSISVNVKSEGSSPKCKIGRPSLLNCLTSATLLLLCLEAPPLPSWPP